MEDFFYRGIWRMDWGFGNPNKTAALIVQFMIILWFLPFLKRWFFWISTIVFTIFLFCLIHTFSRGGMVSLVLGLVPLCYVSFPFFQKKHIIAVLSVLIFAIVISITLKAGGRYSHGIIEQDRSITNRLLLWQSTPQMMHDAPNGWGLGHSGASFMRWYQPLDHHERYRTLVNSHLTWLVEFGWGFRFLYFLTWILTFVLCFPTNNHRWLAVPFSVLITFFVNSFFSSAAESLFLWIIPVCTVLSVLIYRYYYQYWPTYRTEITSASAALLMCVGLYCYGMINNTHIHKTTNNLTIGNGTEKLWVIIDTSIVGEYAYARSVREYFEEYKKNNVQINLIESVDDLPEDLSDSIVVLTGKIKPNNTDMLANILSAERIILLSPLYYPSEIGLSGTIPANATVIYGEFASFPFTREWEKICEIQWVMGIGDYFDNWISVVFENNS